VPNEDRPDLILFLDIEEPCGLKFCGVASEPLTEDLTGGQIAYP